MRPAFSLHGRNPKNDEGLLGPVKFPGIPALDRAADPSGATTIQFVITLVRESQVKTGLRSTSLPPIIPEYIDERLHSLLSSSSIYHARFLPAGHRSVRRY